MTKPVIVKPELQENENEENHGDKTEPRLPDDDGGDDDDLDIDVLPEEESSIYYRPANRDETRRAWVASKMLSPDVDGSILVQNMDLVDKWLKSATLPSQKHERKLKSVKE